MTKKPEHMTHLYGDTLISKCHPRIIFRGKLDSLIARVMLVRCDLLSAGAEPALLADLQEIQAVLQALMRAEVLDRPLAPDTLFGLSMDQIRAQSHALYPSAPGEGRAYALLNVLRTAVRETELAAVAAFGDARPDLAQTLNRLSSAVYILMHKA